ncbi:MAG: phosphatase PAP2 family protein [Flammeovirgaceae bacterium]|nr:MAG: phosphatase PAP2 family protein [Flammeovirgaceae bacterium]
MYTSKTLFSILLSFYVTQGSAQQSDSTQHKSYFTKSARWRQAFAVPGLLISTGVLAATDNDLIDKFEIQEERNEVAPRFRTHADDYLQYAPLVAVYGLNALGLKGEHDFANRTALLVKSELIMMAMVLSLKKFTAVPRPDTGTPNSFPSGHTAEAFVAATFLHKEYGKEHPLISVLGYTTATGIGVLRIMNNRHWASDVITSAGIGILATNLAYLTHQHKWGRKQVVRNSITVAPTYSQASWGMYMQLRLH